MIYIYRKMVHMNLMNTESYCRQRLHDEKQTLRGRNHTNKLFVVLLRTNTAFILAPNRQISAMNSALYSAKFTLQI